MKQTEYPPEKRGFCVGCHQFDQPLYLVTPGIFMYRCGGCLPRDAHDTRTGRSRREKKEKP